MRPAHVYADLTPGQHLELVTALHGPGRVAARIVIILLSASGMSAPEIADLLHYEPVTVRRWITRHTRDGIAGLPDRPAAEGPGWAARPSASASTACSRPRKPGPPHDSGVPPDDPR